MNSDPAPVDVGAVGAAVQWLRATLLGTVATSVAVIAVASVGFLLLSGRIDIRRATQIIFGCFILFGASTIAAAIEGLGTGEPRSAVIATSPPPSIGGPLPAGVNSSSPPVPFDPYAGAALPTHH